METPFPNFYSQCQVHFYLNTQTWKHSSFKNEHDSQRKRKFFKQLMSSQTFALLGKPLESSFNLEKSIYDSNQHLKVNIYNFQQLLHLDSALVWS